MTDVGAFGPKTRRKARHSTRIVDVWRRSEPAPSGQPRRNGPIVRPNVDRRNIGADLPLCKERLATFSLYRWVPSFYPPGRWPARQSPDGAVRKGQFVRKQVPGTDAATLDNCILTMPMRPWSSTARALDLARHRLALARNCEMTHCATAA
jgi:hypothetical protein